MSRRWFQTVCAALMLSTVIGAVRAQDEVPRLEVRLVGPEGALGLELRKAVSEDLRRTPQGVDVLAVAAHSFEEDADVEHTLGLLDISWGEALERPRIELARAGTELTPGWLMHAILRAGVTVGVETDVEDARSSWIGQLIARSTHSGSSGAADEALEWGVPGLMLALPPGDTSGERLLAATVRRLGGLEGYPVFEDQFLVVANRVLLRRDLYWLGLIAWLGLYWRGRQGPGREFRWLLLAAWLVAPVYASLLLCLPALAATWWPERRWVAILALSPVLAFAIRLTAAVYGPPSLVISGIPALLVILALAAFVWQHVLGRRSVWQARTSKAVV